MAFGAKRINPIDTRPSVAIGVAIPFNGLAVFNSTYTTAEALKYNLINFFLTNTNERYLNPEFGAGLRSFIFEQITAGNLEYLKEDLQQRINNQFLNIQIQELNVYTTPSDTDNNTILIALKYSIIGTGINDDLQITLQQ